MTQPIRTQKIRSGTWFVAIVVSVAFIGVAITWVQYHDNNPTTSDATLEFVDDAWVVRARFADDQRIKLIPGTLSIFTSPKLPGVKMSGTIASVDADGICTITVTSGPDDAVPRRAIPCSVTVDAVTAPQSQ